MSDKLIGKKRARRFLRYLIMFLTLIIVSKSILVHELSTRDSFILSTVGVITFAVLDMYYPIIIN